MLEERDGSGNVLARYDYGDDLIRMDRGSSTRYYLFDGLGSTRQLTDGTGSVTDTYAYDAFGNLVAQTGSTVNPYLFNGQEQDAGTGLYYLRARYMNPVDGRFISQDPFGGDNEDPISLHRYLYASGDPVNRVDPSGENDGFLGTLASISINTALTTVSGAIIGGVAGFASVGGLGGNLEQRISGAIAGAGIGWSLAFAYSTDRGPQALISGFLGGASSLILTDLVHPQDEEISPLDRYIAFIRGFSSSAASVALDGLLPDLFWSKIGYSAVFSAVGNIISFSLQDYKSDDYTQDVLIKQAEYTLVDVLVSALLSAAKTGAKGPNGENIKELVGGLSYSAFHETVFDAVFKEIQFCVKSLEKATDLNYDINLDPSYE